MPVVAFAALTSAVALPTTAAVLHLPGTLPLVLAVPHDGTEGLDGVTIRENAIATPKFNRARDLHSAAIALGVAERLEAELGARPHVVLNFIHRAFVDPNRRPEFAYESPEAGAVYRAYHDALAAAVTAALEQSPYALLLDLHGVKTLPGTVYLGTRNGETIASLRGRGQEGLIFGARGLAGVLASRGYWLPAHETQARRKRARTWNFAVPQRVRGGFTVQHYGAVRDTPIDAVQVEIHERVRLDETQRERFIRDFSDALANIAPRLWPVPE